MQFTSWPDYGVPLSATAMLEFLQRMRDMQSSLVTAMGDTWTGHPLGPPIVVHCSAGIGRTGINNISCANEISLHWSYSLSSLGSLCTIDICLRRLEDVGTIDVLGEYL